MFRQGRAGMSDCVLAFDRIGKDVQAAGRRTTIRVLDGIGFDVERGKFVAVIGPSGCGKSTLLQMAAGLLAPTRGAVRHRGRKVTSINTEVGFVPQQAQLFPWKTLARTSSFRCCCAASRRTNEPSVLRARWVRLASRALSGISQASFPAACRIEDRSRARWSTGPTLF